MLIDLNFENPKNEMKQYAILNQKNLLILSITPSSYSFVQFLQTAQYIPSFSLTNGWQVLSILIQINEPLKSRDNRVEI